MKVCNVNGCPTLFDGKGGRCPAHTREADKQRGTVKQRGYSTRGHQAFRNKVLMRDTICVTCNLAFATVADHHPRDRRTLVELGLNPNDPAYGRGLCHTCHSIETAQHQPGGFNA